MNEAFKIFLNYKGEEVLLPAEFIVLTHVFKVRIDIKGQEIIFEPDEEGKFRAIVDTKSSMNSLKIEVDLLKAVADKLERMCKTKAV